MKNKYIITVLGWEERFIKGIIFDINNYNISGILLVIYNDYLEKEPYDKLLKKNLSSLKRECKKKNIPIEISELTYHNTTIDVDSLGNFKKKLQSLPNENLLIDISTIPREMIWNILTYSRSYFETIELIYHKPEKYASWLCRNFDKPLLQLGHSGISRFGKKTALIIITGFDHERTRQLINHFEPDIIYLGIQVGIQFENVKRNIEKHQLFSSPKLIEFFEIDSYNIVAGQNRLEEIVEKLNDYNIILASQGPKLSSIITYNVFITHSNIGLAYVPSNEINIDYSSGISDVIYSKFK